MKKLFSAFITAIVCTVVLALSACGAETVESISKKYSDSLNKVKTVVTTVEYSDSGEAIYTEKRTLDISVGKLVSEKTQIDSTTYKPVTKTTAEDVTVNRSDLKAVELNASFIDSGYTIENGVLKGNVSGERVKSFFGGEFPAFGAVEFKVTLDGKTVASIEYSFTTLEMKRAEVKISYAY